MTFVVAIHHPENYDGSKEPQEMHQAIDDLNQEMVDAGIRRFVGGLWPSSDAKSLKPHVSGEILVTDGPYLETKEHVGGFWVLECASVEEAVEWGKKAVKACRAPVEVRRIGMKQERHDSDNAKA